MCVCCCACLLRGGGDYSLLQSVRLLLEVSTCLMVPQEVLLHLQHQTQQQQTQSLKVTVTNVILQTSMMIHI